MRPSENRQVRVVLAITFELKHIYDDFVSRNPTSPFTLLDLSICHFGKSLYPSVCLSDLSVVVCFAKS